MTIKFDKAVTLGVAYQLFYLNVSLTSTSVNLLKITFGLNNYCFVFNADKYEYESV